MLPKPLMGLLAFGVPPFGAAPPGLSANATSVRTHWRLPGANAANAACATEAIGKLPIQLALRHYVKQANPKPMRFLVAAGTDSALSEMGAKVLQEFGPMYYYAGNDAAKQKLRERLDLVGPFPALLVVKRRSAKPSGNTEVIRLGGHYLTGEHDGMQAAANEYTYVCRPGGWEMKRVKAEGAS